MYDLSTEKHFVSHTKIILLKNYQRIKSPASEPEEQVASMIKKA